MIAAISFTSQYLMVPRLSLLEIFCVVVGFSGCCSFIFFTMSVIVQPLCATYALISFRIFCGTFSLKQNTSQFFDILINKTFINVLIFVLL